MTGLGWLIGSVSLGVIVAVVALAVFAERWPWLRRLFANADEMPDEASGPTGEDYPEDVELDEMSGEWKRDNRIGWREKE